MLEIKTNPEEGSCEMSVSGNVKDIMYDTILINDSILNFLYENDEEAAVFLANILVEHLQEFLDGNVEEVTGAMKKEIQVHVDGDALEAMKALIDAQKGDAA